jgi:hypothetical protein
MDIMMPITLDIGKNTVIISISYWRDVMELKLAVLVSLLILALTTLAPANPNAVCGAVDTTGITKLLFVLVVAAVTMDHLEHIQKFLLAVIGFAGRSNRRLVALGLLLLFLILMLYLADELIQPLIAARSLGFIILSILSLVVMSRIRSWPARRRRSAKTWLFEIWCGQARCASPIRAG